MNKRRENIPINLVISGFLRSMEGEEFSGGDETEIGSTEGLLFGVGIAP